MPDARGRGVTGEGWSSWLAIGTPMEAVDVESPSQRSSLIVQFIGPSFELEIFGVACQLL
jgi:hypothetical protein